MTSRTNAGGRSRISPASRRSSSTTIPSITGRLARSSLRKLKTLNFTWSCTSRVTTDYDTLKAMKDAGCRLLIVGYESGDQQILKNIKKGATIDMAQRFTANCHKLGLTIHGDFIVGFRAKHARHSQDHRFGKEAGCRDHSGFARPRVSGHRVLRTRQKMDWSASTGMTDSAGHQLPNAVYPGFDRGELMEWVERFYSEYYFRPKVAWRVVRKAMFDNNDMPRLYKEAREYLSSAQGARSSSRSRKASAALRGPRAAHRSMARLAEDRCVLTSRPALDSFVVCHKVLGNFSMSWGMKHQADGSRRSPLGYIRLIFTPWVLLGTSPLDSVAAHAHDSARAGPISAMSCR